MARRTKADAQATRAGLLDAAEHLFQSRGVARTSLNDIALAAGTTRGAIYWHFKDKADLFVAMMERVTLPLEQTLAMTDLACGHSPVQQLRHAILQAMRLIARDEQTRRVLLIAAHKVEYTEELCAVQQRHLDSQNAALQYIHTALAAAFAAHAKTPPVPLQAAAAGLRRGCRCWWKGCCTSGCWSLKVPTWWTPAPACWTCTWRGWAWPPLRQQGQGRQRPHRRCRARRTAAEGRGQGSDGPALRQAGQAGPRRATGRPRRPGTSGRSARALRR